MGCGVASVDDLEVFAWFEADGLAGGDADRRAGAGIASDACFTRFDGEDAESAELDAISFGKGLLHGFKDGVDGGFCLGADESGSLHQALGEILFDQRNSFTVVKMLFERIREEPVKRW